jgi:hypothetical protein
MMDQTFTKMLEILGCDEVVLCPCNYLTPSYVLRFNDRYMRLKLNCYYLYLSSRDPNEVLFTYLQTEINEFLLTGKNEITEEVLNNRSYFK